MDEYDGDYVMADNEWDELVWVWQRTDVPKGCRVEILAGLITVTPYSAGTHHGIVERMQRRLYEAIPEGWGIYQRLPMAVPSRLGLYVPDLAVVPREPLRVGDGLVRLDTAELVVEITSETTALHDRTTKAVGYAAAGVPLYLLVDRLAPDGPAVTLYGEPRDGAYRVLGAYGLGDLVTLPEPFALTLDTGYFAHPNNAATPTNTGTDNTVDTRIESRANRSPTP
ncbi:Uma2 family endonuclease [Streptomyces sp. NPDC050759]|uniref:Uma2 family endonuclease n=1 Tax=Streptomyces sp. NPDC050759 TaxID=3365635 RepID=UPI0037AABB1A